MKKFAIATAIATALTTSAFADKCQDLIALAKIYKMCREASNEVNDCTTVNAVMDITLMSKGISKSTRQKLAGFCELACTEGKLGMHKLDALILDEIATECK